MKRLMAFEVVWGGGTIVPLHKKQSKCLLLHSAVNFPTPGVAPTHIGTGLELGFFNKISYS